VTRPARFTLILVQLAAVATAAWLFHIEEALGFVRLLPLILGGFVVHSWLPRSVRQTFFVLLGMAATLHILGPAEGAILCGIGLGLIALCHLPVPFGLRVTLILVVAGVLAALRAGRIEAGWSSKVLPILGAMFMFRLILYLYDLRHEREPVPWPNRLAYFFLLPNVCFPLFPVVDYKMFTRTYYNDDEFKIYQKGVRWMLLGVIQLVLYRAVYLYLIPAPSEIVGLDGVVLFAVSAYLQYMRISGMFHLIVGILCLFGFNLPATNFWYFLASSFTDMWRRINIYWRDFSQKVIYFPVFMRLRKSGSIPAMAPATLAVFACSWLLHSYQWFWIRGDFPVSWVDVAFWGSVSVLVLIATRLETRDKQPASPPLRAAKTLLVFGTMCVLWSLWCSASLADWVDTIAVAGNATAAEVGRVLAIVAGLFLAGTLAAWLHARGRLSLPELGFWTGGSLTAVVALALAAAGFWAPGPIASLIEPRLNQRDAEVRTLGYYEGLLGDEPSARATAPIAAPAAVEESTEAPEDWKSARASGLTMEVDDYRGYDLKPSHAATFKRAAFSTNEWGMRDGPYTKAKPENTFRIALIGASVEMGSGVADGENYESFLERRLNEELSPTTGLSYEVLNFSVAGWGIIQQLAKCELQVFDFEPDAVLVVAHAGETFVVIRHLIELLQRDLPMPERLADIAARAEATGDLRPLQLRQRLAPHIEEITRWGYERIVGLCTDRDVTPLWAFVPLPQDFDGNARKRRTTLAAMTAWAEQAGFRTVDVGHAFDGVDAGTLMVAPWDNHPNAGGNRIIADALYEQLVSTGVVR
jgi:hypothetical protein